MKLAITSQAEGLESAVDPRFGRAKFFVIVDTATNTTTTVANSANLDVAQGAGIQAAKAILDLHVKAVITGHVGPKAFAALKAGNIGVYPAAGGTVAEALAEFKSGALKAMPAADVQGHW